MSPEPSCVLGISLDRAREITSALNWASYLLLLMPWKTPFLVKVVSVFLGADQKKLCHVGELINNINYSLFNIVHIQ